MRKALLSIFAAVICISAYAQATQPCVVKQYNQKEQKTPLAGVEVMVSNAGSQVSDNDGVFTLRFRTLKPGDRVNLVSIKKDGFELMNSEAVEQWNITGNQKPFELVMVNSIYFAQLKGKLKQASTDSYRAKYQQATKELEAALAAGKMKEEEFNQKYDELDTWYQEQLKNLDNYIDQFARIDLSEVSAEEQRILELVEQGQIDEAVKAYEDLDLMGKLRTARDNAKALADAKARIEEEEAAQKQVVEDLKGKLDREIATLKLAGGKENYDKIGRILKENALADTTDIKAVWRYAYFTYSQKDFTESEHFYRMALGFYTRLFAQNPDAYRADLADTQNSLGILHYNFHNYAKSEDYYLKALENKTILFAQNRDAYRADLATTQNNLGNLYRVLQDYPKAEKYHLMALENYTVLFNQYPDAYRAFLAITQNNLGNLYFNLLDYAKSEDYYLKALENKTVLFARDPDAYRADLAMTQNNIGALYHTLLDYTKSEDYYLKALENKTVLFAQNPDAYRADLAMTLHNMGSLFSDLHDYAKAEDYYLMALENYIVLFAQNPDAYRADLAETQSSIGDLYNQTKDYVKAEQYYLLALENYSDLFNCQPESFREKLAWVQYSLVYIYGRDKLKLAHYDSMLDSALANYEVLYLEDGSNQSFIVELRNRKGRRSLENGNTDEALRIFESTYVLDSDKSTSYLASALNVKAYEYLKAEDNIKALETIDRAIEIMPNNANYYDSRGEILLKSGDEKGAVEMWRKVLEVAPKTWTEYAVSDLYKELKARGLID